MKRREGIAKLTGQERYVDDLPWRDSLWGMTVRSPVARGRIREINFGPGIDWDAMVVVDHRDIPGENVIALIEDDQPILAADRVRHIHEPVLLLAHADRETVRRAVRAVEIVIEPESAVDDFRTSPEPSQVQHGPDNVFKHIRTEQGDTHAAMARAAHVIEGIYTTGAQEHVYLEGQGIAAWIEDDTVVVQGSMQCPYYVLGALERGLGRKRDRLRVVHAATGGGFGGKEEFPSGLALHASLLTLKAGRPVKIVYDREEDMQATTKRHPSRVRHRTGVDEDGRLLAQEIDILLDAGAYATLSSVVLSRAVIHAAGPYACDNVCIDGRAVLSNSVPFGAFRGFGAPQAHFASERHMDVIARHLGIDPAEMRRRNLLRDGQSTATGQVIKDGTDRQALQEKALRMADYKVKVQAHHAFNDQHPYLRRGIGMATFHHGAGFTGAGEVYLDSLVQVEGHADGKVEVLAASTEMGQGTNTIFTQLACHSLGYPSEEILIANPDTSRVPDSGPTVASRTAMVVGRLVEKACDDLRSILGLDAASDGAALRQAILDWHAREGQVESPPGRLLGSGRYTKPPGIDWNDQTYRGDAYGAFGWGTYVAEVEVDLRTYTARVIDFVAVQDVGTILNQVLARGQVQGGVVQGIGWALLEECKWRDGAMINSQLTNYIIPTAEDVPPIRVAFVENPYPHGARGAKGLGELPMDGPGPAIANAVAAATGCSPTVLPLTPERLMECIDG